MGNIIEFNHRLKELSCLVRDLNHSNDEVSRSLAITKAQLMLNEYNYDIRNIDAFSVSQFCRSLIALLDKLE